jgi:hypothetical protein
VEHLPALEQRALDLPRAPRFVAAHEESPFRVPTRTSGRIGARTYRVDTGTAKEEERMKTQTVLLSERQEELLWSDNIAIVATVRRDGTPQRRRPGSTTTGSTS